MTQATRDVDAWLARWAAEPYAHLTTIGRRTGQAHRIEIWFASDERRLLLLSGGRDRSDWVRNLQADARVTVELGDETRAGVARVLEAGEAEDQRARELLVVKYATSADPLADWKAQSLAVAIDFPNDAAAVAGEDGHR